MNILFVTGIFPPEIGGPASYIPRLGSKIAERHNVVVITLGDSNEGDEQYPFKVLRVPKSGSKWIRRLRTVKRICAAAQDVDVVLANGLFFETALALPGKVPAVAKVVGDTVWERARNCGETELNLDKFQEDQGLLRLRALHYLQSRFMQTFSKVFTPSAYLKEVVINWGVPDERLSVIPNAVQIPSSNRQSPEVDLVCVARLVPWKGIFELVRLAVDQGWSLALIGDGPLKNDLDAFLKKQPNSKVEIRGTVPMGQVANEIQRGRVFVLNSSYEGLPHVVLEAQAAGVPVVATRAGGTPECVEDGVTGYLVDVGNTNQLCSAIASLLGDRVRRHKIADAALNGIRSRSSFDRMVVKTEKLLTEAAGY